MRSRWGGTVGKTLALGTWAVASVVLLACSTTTAGTGGTGDDDDSGTSDGGPTNGFDSSTPKLDGGTDGSFADALGDDDDDDGGDDDGGACEPGTPTDEYSFHSPVMNTGLCQARQVAEFVTACGTSSSVTSCASFRNDPGNAMCLGCLETPITAASWGAVVYAAGSGVVFANVAGCDYAATSGTEESCDEASEYLNLCEHDACDAPCAGTSYDVEYACETAADSDECETYARQVEACNADDAGTECLSSSFNGTISNVATELCVAE